MFKVDHFEVAEHSYSTKTKHYFIKGVYKKKILVACTTV